MPDTNAEISSVFQGGGQMGALMRAYDWEAHPLGSPSQWPQSLKANVRLLLNSRFPMFIWWSEELYDFHNDAYLPALGKKHPWALGTSAKKIWAEIWENIGGIAQNIMAGGEPFYAENLLLFLERKGFSEETYWTFSYSPIFNDEGQVFGVFCACSETTSTVLGQRRLKSLKDVADAMTQIQTLEQACQATCDILAQNGSDIPFSLIYLLDASETQAKLVGKAGVVEVQAPSVIQMQPAESATAWPLYKVLQAREVQYLEDISHFLTVEKESSAPISQQAVLLPVYRPGEDQMIGFFVSGVGPRLEYDTDYLDFHELLAGQIGSSITSVQIREEATRQQEELMELFQQAPVAIAIMRGPEHVIELANPGICDLWGKRHDQVIGKPVLEALPEVKGQGIIELLDAVFYTGTPYANSEMPVQLVRNGELQTMYFNFVYHPMRDRQGVIIGVIAVAISVNEQVESRHEIENMNTELRAINSDLDNFVYSASHDLKAPISNIEGLLETLVESLPQEVQKQEVVQRVLELMNSSLGRFKRAVADLTQVAKIQREAGEDVSAINLADVVADVRLDFENTISTLGVKIITRVAPDATVQFSAKNVRSIVYNLLSNALKYHAPGRTPEIIISSETNPDFVILSVADNGLGIDPEDHEKIFSMFKRLHDHVEGTGIGLYIVKRIVENAGGKIEVESQPGQGATFKVFFKR
ncbi:MAG: sensor histidine kinase [Rufibacter sp.]